MNTAPKRRTALHLRYLSARKLQPQDGTLMAGSGLRERTCLYLDTIAPPYPVLLGSAAVQAAAPNDTVPCIALPMGTDPGILDAIRQIDTTLNLPLDVQCVTLREAGLPDYQIGRCLGLDRSTVTRNIALHNANPVLRSLVRSGELTLGHARALMRLPDADQAMWARHAAHAKLTIPTLARTLEAKDSQAPAQAAATATAGADNNTSHVERMLSERLGAPVHLAWPTVHTDRTLTIEAWGIESLCGILESIAAQRPDSNDATHYTLKFTGLTTESLDHLTHHLLDPT